mgnify:CR=1 FL=1
MSRLSSSPSKDSRQTTTLFTMRISTHHQLLLLHIPLQVAVAHRRLVVNGAPHVRQIFPMLCLLPLHFCLIFFAVYVLGVVHGEELL